MSKRISEMDAEHLLDLVRGRTLDEYEALEVLRNPFCPVEAAEMVADSRHLLTSHVVREKLSGFRGLAYGRAMDLLASLPWTSLLALAQDPPTPPVVRRQAEKKLIYHIPTMSLGEKVALARKVHRPLLRNLIAVADGQVLVALLNSPRLAETDILVILNMVDAPPEFYGELARHHKWGQYYGVRRGLAVCPKTPLPLALSALVQLRSSDIREIAQRPGLPEGVRAAAEALRDQEQKGLRRVMIRSSENGENGNATDSSEGIR